MWLTKGATKVDRELHLNFTVARHHHHLFSLVFRQLHQNLLCHSCSDVLIKLYPKVTPLQLEEVASRCRMKVIMLQCQPA